MALDPIKPQQNFKFAPRGNNTNRGSFPPPPPQPQQNQQFPEAPEEAFVTKEVAPGDNMWIWAQVQYTPPNACKDFTRAGGFSGTNINAMYRIKKLTEVFGPVGIGWYTTNHKYTIHPCPATGEAAVMCELYLVVRDPMTGEWSQPVFGVGGNLLFMLRKGQIVLNDEGYKMAYTDAIGVACKAFGFSADIYWSADKTKYDLDMESPKVTSLKEAVERMRAIGDKAKAEKGTKEAKEETFEEFMDKADANRETDGKGIKVPLPPRDTCAELKTIFDRLEKSGSLKADAIDYATIMNLLEEECRFLTGREDGDAVLTEALTASKTEDMPNVPMDMLPLSDLRAYCGRAVNHVKKSVKTTA